MTMKVIVVGVVHNRGVSKTGNKYDFAMVRFLREIRTMESKNRQVFAFGFEEATINLDPAALEQFRDIQFPARVDLAIKPDDYNPDRNVCVGILREPKAA